MAAPTGSIRNIAVVGHQGAGKTTLVEAICYAAGAVTRIGRVEEGNTVSDYDPEEQQRQMSINTSLVSLERDGLRFNFLDTPGYADFIGEVIAATAVVDAVIVVVDASSGVQVGTEIAWRLAKKRGIPRFVVVSRLDRDNSSWDDALSSIQELLGSECQPLFLPVGAESDFSGVAEVLSGQAYLGEDGAASDPPADAAAAVADAREGLVEQIVEADEDLMMLYLEDEEISPDDLQAGIKPALLAGSLAPVLPIGATQSIGVRSLLGLLSAAAPSPAEAPAIAEGWELNEAASPAAFVFKTTADEFVGRLSYLRVVGGAVASDSHLENAQQQQDERLANLSRALGKELTSADELAPGDIGVVTKTQPHHDLRHAARKGLRPGRARAGAARADLRRGSRTQDQSRRRQAGPVPGPAGGGRPDPADRTRPRQRRNDHQRSGRTARAAGGRPAAAQVQGGSRNPRPPRALPRDDHLRRAGGVSAQEADRRARAVRPRGAAGGAAGARARESNSPTKSSAARSRATTSRPSKRA